MRFTNVAALSLVLAGAPLVAKPAVQPPIAAALASPTRSADNIKLDAARKPAEVLQFLGLKPGMKVLDLFGANAYWAEIAAPAVGPKGHVAVWEPTQFYKPDAKTAFEAFEAKSPNVSIVSSPFER